MMRLKYIPWQKIPYYNASLGSSQTKKANPKAKNRKNNFYNPVSFVTDDTSWNRSGLDTEKKDVDGNKTLPNNIASSHR